MTLGLGIFPDQSFDIAQVELESLQRHVSRS
jgi:hypothetical protein